MPVAARGLSALVPVSAASCVCPKVNSVPCVLCPSGPVHTALRAHRTRTLEECLCGKLQAISLSFISWFSIGTSRSHEQLES